MFRDTGAEAVLDEIVGACEQAEFVLGDDQVQVAGSVAHRAVALEKLKVGRCEDLDPDTATVTGAAVPDGTAVAQVRGAFHGAARSAPR